jgi:hypothetical protein
MSKILSMLGIGKQKAAVTEAFRDGVPRPRAISTEDELSDRDIRDLVASLLGPVRVGMGRYETAPALPVPSRLIATMAKESEKATGPLLDSQDLERVRELTELWSATGARLNGYSHTSVGKAFAEHQERVAEAAATGAPVSGPRTKDEMRSDFVHHRGTLKIACRNYSAEAAGYFAKAAEKLMLHLQARAEKEAVTEFRRFAQYGVDYKPSELVLTMLSAAGHLQEMIDRTQRPNAGLGADPRQLFATLGIAL